MNCDSLLSFFWVVFKFFVLGVGGVGFGGGRNFVEHFLFQLLQAWIYPPQVGVFFFFSPKRLPNLVEIALENIEFP